MGKTYVILVASDITDTEIDSHEESVNERIEKLPKGHKVLSADTAISHRGLRYFTLVTTLLVKRK